MLAIVVKFADIISSRFVKFAPSTVSVTLPVIPFIAVPELHVVEYTLAMKFTQSIFSLILITIWKDLKPIFLLTPLIDALRKSFCFCFVYYKNLSRYLKKTVCNLLHQLTFTMVQIILPVTSVNSLIFI